VPFNLLMRTASTTRLCISSPAFVSSAIPRVCIAQFEAVAGHEGVVAAAILALRTAVHGRHGAWGKGKAVMRRRNGGPAVGRFKLTPKQHRMGSHCRSSTAAAATPSLGLQQQQHHHPGNSGQGPCSSPSPAAEAAHGQLRLPLVKPLHHHAVVAGAVSTDLQ